MAQRVEQHACGPRTVVRTRRAAVAARLTLFPDGWECGVTFDGLCSCARRPLDPTRDPRSPVPPRLGPGFRFSPLRAAACAYPMALPFGFLTRGAVGVSSSRPEAASAVGTWRQPLHARRPPRRPSSPPSHPRTAPRYGWIV